MSKRIHRIELWSAYIYNKSIDRILRVPYVTVWASGSHTSSIYQELSQLSSLAFAFLVICTLYSAYLQKYKTILIKKQAIEVWVTKKFQKRQKTKEEERKRRNRVKFKNLRFGLLVVKEKIQYLKEILESFTDTPPLKKLHKIFLHILSFQIF